MAREIQAKDSTCLLSYIHHQESRYRSCFPYAFLAKQIVYYHDNKLRLSLEIHNTGDQILQFASGHHTYRAVDATDKDMIRIENITLSDSDYHDWIHGVRTICIPNP